jgi:ribosome-associated protein
MAAIAVTDRIALEEDELVERFVLASGPGGQNVNKVSTAVELRFDAARSSALGEAVRARLLKLAGHLATQDGVVVIHARRFRSQERNRADARERLFDLIRAAAEPPPPPRRPTRPTKASKERRLAAKTVRAGIKRHRARPSED